MAKLLYTINGVNFKSKTELKKYVKNLLNKKPRWVLYGDDKKFILDFIDKMYPCPKEKFGSIKNINSFEVKKYNNNAPALFLLLKSGKKLSISYKSCFLSDKKKNKKFFITDKIIFFQIIATIMLSGMQLN